MAGIITPYLDFTTVQLERIASDSYVIGFDVNNEDKLSKMDHLGNITVIEGAAGGGVIETTYSELMSWMDAGVLLPGQKYQINDFFHANLVAGTAQSNNVEPIEDLHTGSVEPLLVTAASETEIHEKAESVIHPEDEIIYDWTSRGIGVNVSDGKTGYTTSINYSIGDLGGAITVNTSENYLEIPETIGRGFFRLNISDNSGKFFGITDTVFYWSQLRANGIRVIDNRIYFDDTFPVDISDINSIQILANEALATTLTIPGAIVRRTNTASNVSTPWDFRNAIWRRFNNDLSGTFFGSPTSYTAASLDSTLYEDPKVPFEDHPTFGGTIPQQNIWIGAGSENIVFKGSVNVRKNIKLDRVVGASFEGNINDLYIGNGAYLAFLAGGIKNTEINEIDTSTFYGLSNTKMGEISNCSFFGCGNVTVNGELRNSDMFDVARCIFNGTLDSIDLPSASVINNVYFNSNTNIVLENGIQNIVFEAGVSAIVFSGSTHAVASYNTRVFTNASSDVRLEYVDGSNVTQNVTINA